MADPRDPRELTDALSAPLGDLIASVGRGVAEAQSALDAQALETVKKMYQGGDEVLEQLRKIGFQPTWYRIPEVVSELVVSLSISGDSQEQGVIRSSGGVGGSQLKLYAAPIDATYRNKYEFDIQAASRVKFKIVPVPPPSEVTTLRVVPNLTDMTVSQATSRLNELAIPWQHEGEEVPADTAVISDYRPGAGEFLREGQPVILVVESPEDV